MYRSSATPRVCFAALVFAFIIALAGLRAVQADILVKGGLAAQVAQVETVYNSDIPQIWKSNQALPVAILNDHDMMVYITRGQNYQASDADDDDTIDGIYEDQPSRITLRGSTSPNDLPYTFAHEYGHYTWQAFLTRSDRARYAQVYKHQLKAHHLVTDYAATNLDEGFAEAFSFYIVNRSELDKRDHESCKFLDDLVARLSQHKSN